MTKGLVTIDRRAARAIAEELFALMSGEMRKINPAAPSGTTSTAARWR